MKWHMVGFWELVTDMESQEGLEGKAGVRWKWSESRDIRIKK